MCTKDEQRHWRPIGRTPNFEPQTCSGRVCGTCRRILSRDQSLGVENKGIERRSQRKDKRSVTSRDTNKPGPKRVARTQPEMLMNAYHAGRNNELAKDMREVEKMLTDDPHDDAEGFPTEAIPSDDEGDSMGVEVAESHKSGSTGTSEMGAAETEFADQDEVMLAEPALRQEGGVLSCPSDVSAVAGSLPSDQQAKLSPPDYRPGKKIELVTVEEMEGELRHWRHGYKTKFEPKLRRLQQVEEELEKLRADYDALCRERDTLSQRAQRRMDAARRLQLHGIADFPAIFDEAITDGLLRIEAGRKRIMALLLEAMAKSLRAGYTNRLRYRAEVKQFWATIRIASSAKAAIELLRGPCGTDQNCLIGEGHAASRIDSELHYNILGIPSERTSGRYVDSVNPDDDGSPGFKTGKLEAALATCTPGTALSWHADEKDMKSSLREDAHYNFQGDVTPLDFLGDDSNVKTTQLQKTLKDLVLPSKVLVEGDACDSTILANVLRSFDMAAEYVEGALSQLRIIREQRQRAFADKRATFEKKQAGRGRQDGAIKLHHKQATELVRLKSEVDEASFVIERASAYLGEVQSARDSSRIGSDLGQSDGADEQYPEPAGSYGHNEHDQGVVVDEQPSEPAGSLVPCGGDRGDASLAFDVDIATLVTVAKSTMEILPSVVRLLRVPAKKLLAVMLHPLDHAQSCCIARYYIEDAFPPRACGRCFYVLHREGE